MPSHGRFVGASSLPFSEYKRKQATGSVSTGASPTSEASGPCGTSSTTRTGGSPSCMLGWRYRWVTEAACRSSVRNRSHTDCSPSRSLPSTSSKPQVVDARSTNGSSVPSSPTITGWTVWLAAPSHPPVRTSAEPSDMSDASSESKSTQRGIECPNCSCRHFYVVYTRPRSQKIVRRKECRNCGRRILTFERMKDGVG